MIQCDECKKLMYEDSREEKGAYVCVKVDDPVWGFSRFHLCRKCFQDKFPWLCGDDMREEGA